MDVPKRSRRRMDLARMKAKARKLYPHDPQAKLADHLAECSCPSCGNQRRHEGPPIRELRAGAFDPETV